MAQHRLPRLALPVLTAALFLLPGAVRAQEQYTFTVGLLGGLGGSVDVDPGDDIDNTGFQLNFAVVTEPRTHVGIRAGRLGLDSSEQFGSLTDAELTYATVAGEYRFPQSYHESGMYIGLGGYRLDGTRGGQDESDTAVGLNLGVTGELKVNRWLGVLIELSGHYTDLDEANMFVMGHAGVAIHF